MRICWSLFGRRGCERTRRREDGVLPASILLMVIVERLVGGYWGVSLVPGRVCVSLHCNNIFSELYTCEVS